MALDNAQFISELSIIDPPGTDAIAEGDDHIRTTKRATQQSFPNVDAAVPQTAAQMAQMAIKNEVNTFTQANTFNGVVTHTIGARLDIQDSNIRFNLNGFDQGIQWRTGLPGNILHWQFLGAEASGGDIVFQRYNDSGVFQDTPLTLNRASGEAVFANTIDVGNQIRSKANLLMQQKASNNEDVDIRFQQFTPGATRWRLRSTATSFNFQFRRQDVNGIFVDSPITISAATGEVSFPNSTLFRDGSGTNPSMAFTTQPGTGIYRPGTSLGFAINGSDAAFLLPAQFRMILNGSQAAPAYSFQGATNAGMFVTTGPVLQFATSGLSRMFIRANGVVNIQNLPTSSAGLVKGDLWISSAFVAVIP